MFSNDFIIKDRYCLTFFRKYIRSLGTQGMNDFFLHRSTDNQKVR